MEYLVNAKEMKYCDANTSDFFGINSIVLMERAALAVVNEVKKHERYSDTEILIVCGVGNNGADGLAVSRMLFLNDYCVSVLILGDIEKATPEFKVQYNTIQKYKIPVFHEWMDKSYSLIIDSIFGIGLSRSIEGKTKQIIERMNENSVPVLAIDIASGINTDDGSIMGIAVNAEITVTFAYKKIGQLLYPGANYTGTLIVADIGINDKSWLEKKPSYGAFDLKDLKHIPNRKKQSNKGTYGKVLLIAGSADMSGAAILSAKAAYASGCGLVKVYTPKENRMILQQAVPEAILSSYDSNKIEKEQLVKEIQWANIIAMGPGMGKMKIQKEILKIVLENASVPLVLDADALNILAEDTDLLLRPHTEYILTPHLGEMARLRNSTVSFIQKNMISVAEEFAREYNVICVLKDATSICSIPYGKTYLNLSGNPGMATAGSGDVLTGIIASLIAQGVVPETAAPLGTYIHGLSGDIMIQHTGMAGLMASDIIHGIKKVMKQRDNSETL